MPYLAIASATLATGTVPSSLSFTNTALGTAGLVAPELQITHETSVIGYANYMQTVIQSGIGDIDADYASLKGVAGDAATLMDKVALWFAGGQVSPATREAIITAVL